MCWAVPGTLRMIAIGNCIALNVANDIDAFLTLERLKFL